MLISETKVPAGGGSFNVIGLQPTEISALTIREIAGDNLQMNHWQEQDHLRVAQALSEVTVPVQAGNGTLRTALRPGSWRAIGMTLTHTDGKQTVCWFSAKALPYRRAVSGGRPGQMEDVLLADAYLDLPAGNTRYFIRPNPDCYQNKAREDLLARWDTLPAASAHTYNLLLEMHAGGTGLWVDGNYAGTIADASTAPLRQVTFLLPTGAAYAPVQCAPSAAWERWLPLELTGVSRAGAMHDATLVLQAGTLSDSGVPFPSVNGAENTDIGTAKNVSPPFSYNNDSYPFLERSAFDTLPESLLFSVPGVQYTRAWVLCAAEDDPSRLPLFTLRLTRYHRRGIGSAMVNSVVSLPLTGETPSGALRQVGTVEYQVAGARKRVPLWLAEVSLNSAEIQDVIDSPWAGGRLDLEFLGKLAPLNAAFGADPAVTSGVHLFGITLEKSPVEMRVTSAVTGGIFQNTEQPAMQVDMRPAHSGDYMLRWVVHDVHDKPIADGARPLHLTAGAADHLETVPLAMADNGWYG